MTPVKVILVAGPGGARTDFVAGWLGTLPNFIDNFWSIDIASGKSRGLMDGAKPLDQNADLDDILADKKITLDPDASLYWAGSCHGFRLKNISKKIVSSPIQVLPISIQNVSRDLIHWEFIIKTYSEPKKTFRSYPNQQAPTIDKIINNKPITDQDRADKLQDILRVPETMNSVEDYLPTELLGNLVDYHELFCPGGSYLLCDILNITSATKKHHTFWDLMLPAADAPKTIVSWGNEFSMRR